MTRRERTILLVGVLGASVPSTRVGTAIPGSRSLMAQARVEMNPDRRRKLIYDAIRTHKEDVGHIPLYETMVLWGRA